jgi:hypothetical protein
MTSRDPAVANIDIGLSSLSANIESVSVSIRTQTVKGVSSFPYQTVSSDSGKMLTISNGASNVTINTGQILGLSTGQSIDFLALGTGVVTFSQSGLSGSAATLNATPGFKLRATYSAATLYCVSANNYVLFGDLAL